MLQSAGVKRLCLAFLLFSLCLSAAATASADPVRFHAGVGLGGVVGRASGPHVLAGALNPTLVVDLGARLAPAASVYLRAEGGGIMYANQAAGYAVAEWLPIKRLSLATGVGVDAMLSYCQDCIKDNIWTGVSVPLIVGIGLVRTHAGTLRLGLEGAAGMDSAQVVGWHASTSVEWVWN